MALCRAQLHKLMPCVQERAREARGYTAFSESEWVLNEQELPSLPGGFGWTLPPPSNSHQLRGSDYQARMRKVCNLNSIVSGAG